MEKHEDLYQNYESKKYAHYRNVRVGTKIEEVKGKMVTKPLLEGRKIDFEEIKAINLDKIGSPVPFLDTEDFTIVSNYLIDFWGAIIGSEAVQLYLHLKRYAYGKRDYCFPDIELIALKMGKSRNTIKKYLDILEEHGFIVMFLRRDITDNNRDVSPLFKIRRYVPLITKEMYDSLHPKLKKLHDEFMANFEGVNFNEKFSGDDLVVGLLNKGKAMKKIKENNDKAVEERKLEEYVLGKLDMDKVVINEKYHEFMRSRISKPTYEVYVKNSIFVLNNDFEAYILVHTQPVKDWLENRYENMILEFANEFTGNDTIRIKCILINEYIWQYLRRVH